MQLNLPFKGMLVAILPPGAFFGVAALLALRNLARARATGARCRGQRRDCRGARAAVKPAKRRAIFERFAKANPNPTTELKYTTPFELLVAVVLSAQATDKGVNKATRELFKVANTPQAMLDLGEDGLKELHQDDRALQHQGEERHRDVPQSSSTEHGGEVPRDREALEALPGVGRKTANVVLNTAFGEPTIAVDTHIFRVANRTGLAPGGTVRAVEDKLVKVTPDEFKRNAHHWLILHGRYVCKARKPDCPRA